MRRRNRGSGEGVLIDLTSLLDVIFILLMVVAVGMITAGNESQATREELQVQTVETQQKREMYEEMLETQNAVQEYIWEASVRVPYDPNTLMNRKILLLNEGEELLEIELNGSDVQAGLDTFTETLSGFIEEHADRPVILVLNEEDEKILYRDEVAVNEILLNMARKYNNVYIRGGAGE